MGECIPPLPKEFAVKNPVSLIFSTQHVSGDRWSFQGPWSVSIYNEKYINLLLHSIGVRLKHLFQITPIP